MKTTEIFANATTDSPDLDTHVREFKAQGFTVFPQVFAEAQMEEWRQLFQRFQAQGHDKTHPSWWFGGVFERAPDQLFPAVANPLLLDFAERVMGPFVQLDNLSLVGFPSVDPETAHGKVSGWHRDRWAGIPNAYARPLAINAISYFQDLTALTGPLRVIPGSHAEPITVAQQERNLPHPQEVVLCPRAGDVVFIHNALLHSGTPNTSGQTRYFFSLFYNLTWLHATDDHSGPATETIRSEARARQDRRLLRLFGEDPQMPGRANSGFVQPDEELWEQWRQEDLALLQP